jgi:hypothetical protein
MDSDNLGSNPNKSYGLPPTRKAKLDFPRGLLPRIMRELIDKQKLTWDDTPKSERQFIRIDQSDLFYDLRKNLEDMGYDVSKLVEGRKREEIVSYIKTYCDKLGVHRHQIGIFAADRAILLFKGVEYSVNYDNIKRLMRIGADIICIEKEGIVEKLGPFVKDLGIALLHSKGFIAENAVILAQLAKEHDANVAILSDFDAAGISLAISLKGIIRIGVDFDTIDEINKFPELKTKLTVELLQERYNPADHWTQLKNLSKGKYRNKNDNRYHSTITNDHLENYKGYLNKRIGDTDETYVEFLRTKRFELNTIRKEVGSEIFWKWLRNKILETFPTRNYNRAVFLSDYLLTPTMIRFFEGLKKYSTINQRFFLSIKDWSK